MNTAPLFSSPTDDNPTLTLSDDQNDSADTIVNFLLDPEKKNLILAGFAGVGKSTLLKHVIDELPRINKLAEAVGADKTERTMHLTATTNKAAGALRQTTGLAAQTIHSTLGLALERNETNFKQELVVTGRTRTFRDDLFIVDEAFMADPKLMQLMSEYMENCKVLWVGDPAQLTPVGMNSCPLETRGFDTTTLSQVHRQAEGSPIIQLATLCRYAVLSGKFFKFEPDGDVIQHVSRVEFDKQMLEEFEANGKTPGAVKALAWTNKGTLAMNSLVKQQMKGTLDISVGDYVVCNSAMRTRKIALSTDQTVQITGKRSGTEQGLEGHYYDINSKGEVFMPTSLPAKRALLKALKKDKSAEATANRIHIEDKWADLRDEYACTINKSQGSTYGTVFIDLADVGRCKNPNQLARLLYVATSRAANRIVFTGDIR
jgi:ATP-dependent exoDNAse (exonuclease V) alpha subunit